MILVDFNQVCISNFMMQVGNHTNLKIEEDLVRHMVLNTLRMVHTKFKNEYGQMVLCADSKKYWRKDVFPYYKANRKKDRESSDVDWNALFKLLNQLRDEIKENFPYKVLVVIGAEADDIIGTLVKHNTDNGEPILIVSSDKDFMQLQKYSNVDQWSPKHKTFLKTPDPKAYVFEHILKGDRGDGIPNFLSPDDTFVTDKRQKPLTSKKIETIKIQGIVDPMAERGFNRNQHLIDLDFIPVDLQQNILKEYNEIEPKPRSLLLNYFVKHKLKNLTESIGDF